MSDQPQVTYEGVNDRGNTYEVLDHGANATDNDTYRYSNTDGTTYEAKPDGSAEFDNGRGMTFHYSPNESNKS